MEYKRKEFSRCFHAMFLFHLNFQSPQILRKPPHQKHHLKLPQTSHKSKGVSPFVLNSQHQHRIGFFFSLHHLIDDLYPISGGILVRDIDCVCSITPAAYPNTISYRRLKRSHKITISQTIDGYLNLLKQPFSLPAR